MHIPTRFLVAASRVVTCAPSRETPNDPLGVIENGAILVNDGRIEDVAERAQLTTRHPSVPLVLDAEDGVMTPGLVDAHTHLAWGGSRHDEYVLRMQGADYEQLAASGGGIVASTRAVRDVSEQRLTRLIGARLSRMARMGTTTCEIKSGYGLSLEAELKQLRAIRDAAVSSPRLPRVVPTFLPLHALPPEGRTDRAGWISQVISEWLPTVAASGLAKFVDAYIDRAAFSAGEARPFFERAKELGLGIRAHVGQFADVGGAALAASLRAASVDHMENVSDEALLSLATSGTRAVLLPVASFTLRQEAPPVSRMRAAGVSMVIASDANPGTAPTLSLPMAMAMALHSYGMTPEECLLGATREAAASLGLQDTCGHLSAGLAADIVVWDLPHERALLQPWGTSMSKLVLGRGQVLHAAAQRLDNA